MLLWNASGYSSQQRWFVSARRLYQARDSVVKVLSLPCASLLSRLRHKSCFVLKRRLRSSASGGANLKKRGRGGTSHSSPFRQLLGLNRGLLFDVPFTGPLPIVNPSSVRMPSPGTQRPAHWNSRTIERVIRSASKRNVQHRHSIDEVVEHI